MESQEQYQDTDWCNLFEDPPTIDLSHPTHNQKPSPLPQHSHPTPPLKKQHKPLPSISIKYPFCPKGGYHNGEILNLMCTQPKCSQNSVICSLCYDEQHSTHQVKPIKIIIQNARNYLSANKQQNINTDKIKSIITDSQNSLKEKYQEFGTMFNTVLAKTRENIGKVYVKLNEEIGSKFEGESSDIISRLQGENDQASFKSAVKELVMSVADTISEEQGEDVLTQQTLKEEIVAIKEKMEKHLATKGEFLTKKLEEFLTFIRDAANNYSLFSGQSIYVFSPTLHHPGVSLLTPTNIISTQGNNYHFALMQPSLESRGNKTQSVQFKITDSSQQWIAIGICHKQTIVSNGFNFNYSAAGHGAYLISSNGGSWSTLDLASNNVVTSFIFEKGAVITVKYDPVEQKVTFNKKNTKENHSLGIQNIEGNELHLCVLFYYKGDKVEYLGPQKPT